MGSHRATNTGTSEQRALEGKRRAENFPVALRVLPPALRTDLVAVYDVARTIDDLGDEAAGDRTAQLDEFARDLATVWQDGNPVRPELKRLVPTVVVRALPREPFERLVQANRVDQQVTRYPRFADLLSYCTLSAEPVGRIVLGVFDASTTPTTCALSDRVCTALQLVEHWQDVAEDRRAGRIYLPQEDMARFGVAEADLDAATAGPALRALIAFETDRAEELLDSGPALVRLLRGWARVAVAGYVAGGRAAIDAVRRVDHDVLSGSPPTRRRDVARHLTRLLLSGACRSERTALSRGGVA